MIFVAFNQSLFIHALSDFILNKTTVIKCIIDYEIFKRFIDLD
jgi:hypothetical protein